MSAEAPAKPKIVVEANPKCKYCLGRGKSKDFFGPNEHVCSCVVEQLRIVTFDPDYSIPSKDRYVPGWPEIVPPGEKS